jgi:alpha-beta hydrolase superfamily lysophospholipase
MSNKTQTITRGNAPALYFTTTTASEPKAVLALIHGYADHGERYHHVTKALAEQGITTITVDLRGHGRSEGHRGYCDRFSEFLDDASELTKRAQEQAGELPWFLFGHSFGGVVATRYIQTGYAQPRGLILSNPFFGLQMPVPALKIKAGEIASRIYPKLGLPSGLKGKDVTHDEARARAYDTDPLVFKKATARWFTETRTAQDAALAEGSKITLPLYLLFGESDGIASQTQARAVYNAAGSKDKTWDGRPGLLHETLNEPVWAEITKTLGDWILAHAK